MPADPAPPPPTGRLIRPALHDGRRGIPAWKRRRACYWLVALALAGVLGLSVTASLDATADRVASLGPTAHVAVAAHELPLGAVVDGGALEWRDLPIGAVATDAVTDRQPSVIGRTVAARIARGEPISAARLAPTGLEGVAARTPIGRHAVAIPVDARTPVLVIGQHVDLYAGAHSIASGIRAGGEPVALDALVVDLDDRRATVAVDAHDLAATTAALVDATIIVTVTGGA